MADLRRIAELIGRRILLDERLEARELIAVGSTEQVPEKPRHQTDPLGRLQIGQHSNPGACTHRSELAEVCQGVLLVMLAFGVVYSLVPVFVALLAVFFFGEAITLVMLASAALVLMGLHLMLSEQR